MTDEQYQALEQYLRAVQGMLLLGDWELFAWRERCSGQAWAYVEISEHRDTAWIKVAWPEFFDGCTREEQRLYLAHELVHVMTAPILRAFQSFVGREEEESTKVYRSEHRKGVEIATHKMARIIATMLPYPDFPRTKDLSQNVGIPQNPNIAGVYVDSTRRA